MAGNGEKKRYVLPNNMTMLMNDVESKTDSEQRDNVLQAQINRIKKDIKELKKHVRE